jgi:hypothetical protein
MVRLKGLNIACVPAFCTTIKSLVTGKSQHFFLAHDAKNNRLAKSKKSRFFFMLAKRQQVINR